MMEDQAILRSRQQRIQQPLTSMKRAQKLRPAAAIAQAKRRSVNSQESQSRGSYSSPEQSRSPKKGGQNPVQWKEKKRNDPATLAWKKDQGRGAAAPTNLNGQSKRPEKQSFELKKSVNFESAKDTITIKDQSDGLKLPTVSVLNRQDPKQDLITRAFGETRASPKRLQN